MGRINRVITFLEKEKVEDLDFEIGHKLKVKINDFAMFGSLTKRQMYSVGYTLIFTMIGFISNVHGIK